MSHTAQLLILQEDDTCQIIKSFIFLSFLPESIGQSLATAVGTDDPDGGLTRIKRYDLSTVGADGFSRTGRGDGYFRCV